jgi:hypothetical protein
MTNSELLTNVAEGVLALALVVFISVRQLRWTAVVPSRMWRMPVILAIVGVVTLSRASLGSVSSTDLALLALEAVIAIGTGCAMGLIARFRPISHETALRAVERRPGTPVPEVESSTGWIGMVLWIVVIAARIAIGFWGHAMGSALVESTGVVLLVIALNRGARILVVLSRLERHQRTLVS